VGDIGDELAAHASGRFDSRDVARQQQLLLVAIRNDLDRQRHAGLALRRHDDGLREIPGVEIADHFGLADEVRERPAEIALGLEPEMRAVARAFANWMRLALSSTNDGLR
jgi:hypothetical protein